MANPEKPLSATIPAAKESYSSLGDFRVRFMKVAGAVMTVVAMVITVALANTGAPMLVVGLLSSGVLIAAASTAMAFRGHGEAAVNTVIFGVTADASVFLFLMAEQYLMAPIAIEIFFVLAVFSAFLSSPQNNIYFGVIVIAVLAATTGLRVSATPEIPLLLSLGITDVVHFILLWAAATQVSRHLRANQTSLRTRLQEIDVVVERARKVATGDLSADLAEDSEISIVIHEMLIGLRDIVREVQESLRVLATATTNMDSMASQQQRGAVHQSSAVAETRETIQSFATSSHKIASAAEGVLNNATSTQQTNERANEQLNALAGHTRRINELLEFVKDISNKSEILALNAALEGTKAGEAGRGFSLVAAQMQRLAESTANTIKDVKSLTTDITKSTSATVISMEEATKLARDTTLAAQQITLITQQQSSGAEQVLEAMNDIATVTNELADGTEDALSAIAELKALSDRLNEVAHRFVL
jgi:methyl-accepting chemotaxis protein